MVEFREIVWRSGPELTAEQLHDLLALRIDVFVVEQDCAYHEVDGHDLLADTDHGWITVDGEIVAAVRLLGAHDPPQIGRVVTRVVHRGGGLARRLVLSAHERAGQAGTFLEAQSYLVGWYESLGWSASGPEFVEDGIPHVPMRRPA